MRYCPNTSSSCCHSSSRNSISLPIPPVSCTSSMCPYGPATEHDLVFNGVCFEAGFPFCGKGFMTAFYGIRNTQMDEWVPHCLFLGRPFLLQHSGCHLFKVCSALWRLSHIFWAARGVCVMCVRPTLKMYLPNEGEIGIAYRLKC